MAAEFIPGSLVIMFAENADVSNVKKALAELGVTVLVEWPNLRCGNFKVPTGREREFKAKIEIMPGIAMVAVNGRMNGVD